MTVGTLARFATSGRFVPSRLSVWLYSSGFGLYCPVLVPRMLELYLELIEVRFAPKNDFLLRIDIDILCYQGELCVISPAMKVDPGNISKRESVALRYPSVIVRCGQCLLIS